jgi:hypothetical protein
MDTDDSTERIAAHKRAVAAHLLVYRSCGVVAFVAMWLAAWLGHAHAEPHWAMRPMIATSVLFAVLAFMSWETPEPPR